MRIAKLLAGAVLAQAGQLHAADVQAGKVKAQACIACHGEQGVSSMQNTPSLAGQPDGFIQWQLVYFRGKTRKDDIMGPIAAALTNADIRDLGAYFSSLSPPPPLTDADPDTPRFARGAKLAQANRCSTCHGETYAGQQAVARIAHQREDYLLKALRDFHQGKRTGGGIAAMPDAVYRLSDEDLQALAHYLARFQ
ncbi:MAG: cytochrome c4 [Burkholderiales bacterium]|nr:cytochrome c4 [Burkholderiales bacterium]